MRTLPLLGATLVALAVVPGTAAGAPDPGGAAFGSNIPRPAAQPVATMRLVDRVARVGDALPPVRFRVDQRGIEEVRARLTLVRVAGKAPVVRRSAGWVPTGQAITLRWPAKAVAPRSGRYEVRLHVTDSRGRRLRRTRANPGRTLLTVRPAAVVVPPVPLLPAPAASPRGRGVFPIAGPFSFGGPDARFGVGRPGHVHQGQDIMAAEGQPIVAPYGGTVSQTAYQPTGAGEYIVLDAVDDRDYFFAHCQRGTTVVRAGQRVGPGDRLCNVGSTGRSDGAHLHFEIWLTGWRVPGGVPIDPLPELRAWAGS